MEKITKAPVMATCRNADNPGAFWCYFRPGAEVPSATVDAAGECRACARTHCSVSGELPSFLQPDAEL